MSVPKRTRRASALKRLEAQLASGKKNTKEGLVDLTEQDKARIQREINILTSRV